MVFEQTDVEFPTGWSQTAVNVVTSKYFRGQQGSPERETSLRQVLDRVAGTIAGWGREDGYFASEEDAETFEQELRTLLLDQSACFNSPVWFNVGIFERPQCSACFINSVEDSMASIMRLAETEALLFKHGSGTGSNLSALRGSKEPLSGGGTSSGPVSFMRGYDAFAGVVKSGGRTRRAAKMVILDVDHPDIEEFIHCKENEEKKAWALIEQGYDGGFAVPGGAYDSVFFQNANHSVRVPDEFMEAALADGTWQTRARTNGEVVETLQARDLLQGDRRVDLGLRRSRHAVRHRDQPLAHLQGEWPHQRLEPVQRVHVPRRHGLQPGFAQPAAFRATKAATSTSSASSTSAKW